MESASTWEIRRRHLPTNLSYGQPTYLDATADGVDKGSGIKWLAHYLGLEPGRIAAIGDGHNDLGMLSGRPLRRHGQCSPGGASGRAPDCTHE